MLITDGNSFTPKTPDPGPLAAAVAATGTEPTAKLWEGKASHPKSRGSGERTVAEPGYCGDAP